MSLSVICTDERRIQWSRGTGASSYARALRQSLPLTGFATETLVDAPRGSLAPTSRAYRLAVAAIPGSVTTNHPAAGVRVVTDVFRRAQIHFDIYGRYLRLRGTNPPALMHWSYPLPIRFVDVPNIYSVLDLIPLLQPDLTPIKQMRAKQLLHRLRYEAAHLVTISETSRQEIISTLDWPSDRVTNTSLAVDVSDMEAVQPGPTTAIHKVTREEYFLHVGTIEKRKNIARLISAYRASGSNRALVLVGPDGWGATEELAGAVDILSGPDQATFELSERPRVIRIDWVSRSAILGLIKGATAILAPSLAEGFGLPVVEAMTLGTPALTSRGGATQEVAGNAALLVDPTDVRDITAGIAALDRDPTLREAFRHAGLLRAQAFTTTAYAARLTALYGAVLDRARANK